MNALFFLLPLILIVVIVILNQRSRARAAEQLIDTLKPEASMRGWAFETDVKRPVRLLRWKGADFEVQWVAEALEGPTGSGTNRGRTNQTRWRTTGISRGTGMVLFMATPEGREIPKTTALADGLLGQLAMKAVNFALDKAIDVYFGEEIGAEVDPNDFQRMEALESQLPGFAIMASSSTDVTQLVQGGLGEALKKHINSGADALGGRHRPWVLIWKGGVALGRVGAVQSAAELDPIVRAGVAIARALN